MTFRLHFKYHYRSWKEAWQSLRLFRVLRSASGRAGLWCAIILLTVGYVWETNHLSTSGYVMQKLEREIRETERELKSMESEAARLQSMTSIEARLKETNLVAVTNIRYFKATAATALAGR